MDLKPKRFEPQYLRRAHRHRQGLQKARPGHRLHDSADRSLHGKIMKEARAVTANKTISETAERLHEAIERGPRGQER